MEIRKRYYPYPVLAKYTDDYKNGEFDTTEVKVSNYGNEVHIDYTVKLNEPDLQKLINNGDAYAVFHLECPQTGYREAVKVKNPSDKLVIKSERLNGEFQICSFIVAAKNIVDYTSINFHDDYAGLKFNIDMGCVLAVGDQITANIDKDKHDFSDLPSIFCVIGKDDRNFTQMQVDYSENKIKIELPYNDYIFYKQLYKLHGIKDAANAIVVIPALTYVLSEILKMDKDSMDELRGKGWYTALKNKLKKDYQKDIEDGNCDINPLEFAQRLIDNPGSKALKRLCEETGDMGGDE